MVYGVCEFKEVGVDGGYDSKCFCEVVVGGMMIVCCYVVDVVGVIW